MDLIFVIRFPPVFQESEPLLGGLSLKLATLFLLIPFYLTGSVGLPTTACQNWLARMVGGVEIPECGCVEEDCDCGAPCCSPEAKQLRAQAENALLAQNDACCDATDSDICCTDNTNLQSRFAFQIEVLKTACTCGTGPRSAHLALCDSHLGSGSPAQIYSTPNSPANPHQPPSWVSAIMDPPDKVPISFLHQSA